MGKKTVEAGGAAVAMVAHAIESALMFLTPDEIVIDDSLNVRPFSTRFGDTEEELRDIQELAESMQSAGQVQPVKVRLMANGTKVEAHLIAGHRRYKAAVLINMGLAEGQEPFRLACAVEVGAMSDVDARRQAMIENIKRKGISPMDYAADLAVIRVENGWEGKAGTRKVAEYLKVSTATVTQYEKLNKLVPELQEKVHRGEIAAQAAMDLADEKPEKQVARLAQAVKLQAGEQETEPEVEREKGDEGPVEPPTKKKSTGRKTGKVQQKHVRKAQREADDADENLKKPLTRTEILAFFVTVKDSPAYGYPDGAARQFAAYLVDKWAVGQGSDRTFDKYFDEMTAKADKGTKAAADKENERIAAELAAKKPVKKEAKQKAVKATMPVAKKATKKKK